MRAVSPKGVVPDTKLTCIRIQLLLTVMTESSTMGVQWEGVCPCCVGQLAGGEKEDEVSEGRGGRWREGG